MKNTLLLLVTLLLSGNTLAANEKYYQAIFCGKASGQMEVVLGDRTRVDCLTFGMAIEVEFAAKWAESVGQSMHYALMTGRHPGVALIMLGPKDCKYGRRIRNVVSIIRPLISVWEVGDYAGKCVYE